MPGSRSSSAGALLLLLATISLSAQERVVVLPGAGSASGEVTLLPSTGFSTSWTASAYPGAFKAIASADGSRLYVLSNSNGAGWLTVVSPAGEIVANPVSVGAEIIDAELAPDGRRLVLLSPGLRIYDVAGSSVVRADSPDLGEDLRGLAVSHDSRRVYVLDAAPRLIAVSMTDPGAGAVSTPLPASPSSITVGPNGLLYVGVEGKLLEYDGASNGGSMSLRKTIELPAGMLPGKAVFTPDGSRLVIVNPMSVGITAAVYSFQTAEVTTLFGTVLTQIAVPADDGFYGIALDGKLYAVPFSTLHPAPTRFTFEQPVVSAVVSDEASRARNLYVITEESATARTLTRVDLNAYSIAEMTSVAGTGVVYAAPGATGTVAAIVASIQAQAVAAGARTLPLVVRVTGSNDRGLMNAPVSWTADAALTPAGTPMSATNISGYAQAVYTAPQAEGEYKITATSGGKTAEFTIRVGPPSGGGDGGGTTPSRVIVVSGQGQVNWQGWAPFKPIAVQALSSDGSPLADAEVTWNLTAVGTGSAWIYGDAESGCVTPAGLNSMLNQVCPTDADGTSAIRFQSVSVPPNTAYAQFKLTARATKAGEAIGTATVYMTVLPSGANLARALDYPAFGTTITLPRGQVVDGAIQVRVWTGSGSPLPNVGITVSGANSGSQIQCAGGTVLTNTSGVATCNLVASGVFGETGLVIDIGAAAQLPYSVRADVVPGPPGLIAIISGNEQSGPPESTLAKTLVAEVRDGAGNPLPGAAATWEVISPAAGATLNPTSSTADANGRISTQVKLGSTPGQVTIRARAGAASADFTATVVAPITAFTKISGDEQSVAIGSAFSPVVVKITGASGAPLQNIPVSFAVTSGSVTPTTASVLSGTDGTASLTLTAGSEPGPVTVTASAPGAETLTFNLHVRQPGPVLTAESFLNGASFRPGIAAGAIISIVTDGLLDGVPSMPVDTCISPGNVIGPLPLRLAGVEVQFSDRMAPVFAVCRTAQDRQQINVQAPFDLAPATIDAVVRTGAGTDSAKEVTVNGIQVLSADPGIFQTVAEGQTIAVAFRPDGSLVTPSNPAHAGETIRIYATGLGPVVPSVGTNQTGLPDQAPEYAPVVQVGGTGAAPVTGKYAENMIGVFTVTFVMPTVSGNVEIRLDMVRNGDQLITGSTATIPVQ